jgi:hypothetical protein
MVGDGNGHATGGGGDCLNAKDSVGRVGALAAAGVREVAVA